MEFYDVGRIHRCIRSIYAKAKESRVNNGSGMKTIRTYTVHFPDSVTDQDVLALSPFLEEAGLTRLLNGIHPGKNILEEVNAAISRLTALFNIHLQSKASLGKTGLCFIGVGNSESVIHHNNSLMVMRNSKRLIMDCGVSARLAIHDLGLNVGDIDAIVITHVHADHVGGLERFGFDARYKHNGHRIKLFVPADLAEGLWENSLKGGMEFTSAGQHELTDFFEVILIEEDVGFEWENMKFSIFPTPHVPSKKSYGVSGENVFCYTSDSNVLPNMGGVAENVKYIFHDSSMALKIPSHAYMGDILDSYPFPVLRKIWVMHLEDESLNLRIPEVLGGRVQQGALFFADGS